MDNSYKTKKRVKSSRYLIYLFFLFCQVGLFAQSDKITLEAASSDPTLVVRGNELTIETINQLSDKVFIKTTDSKLDFPVTGVLIDKNNLVIDVFSNQQIDCSKITDGNYLVAVQASKNAVAESFIKSHFKKKDVVKLRKNGNISNLKEILGIQSAQLKVDRDKFTTVYDKQFLVNCELINKNSSSKYQIVVSDQKIQKSIQNKLALNCKLQKGVNYINIVLLENSKKISEENLVVFYKEKEEVASKIKVLWIEQFPNAKVLTNRAAVDSMLKNAKIAGFTHLVLDVKGPEGYVSYRKNNLSHTPYFTSTSNPNKKINDDGFDLLGELTDGAKKGGFKMFVSFNFFTEGNVTTQDYAVLRSHPEWEEMVQRPEDKGQILKISESKVGQEAKLGKRVALAFVNPANPEVVDFQLLRVKEVLDNYAIDGIVLDRTRFDNFYADFSELSKNKFAEYLKQKGKQLDHFPNDAFSIDSEGKMVEGKYFIDWITFRSTLIKEFASKVRKVVNEYKASTKPNLQLAAYVGSWYETYYQNGVNWASSTFNYNPILGFPESKFYSAEYSKTSYLDNLDFIMIGTYYKTDKEIAKYVTLGNILVDGKIPVSASLSLPDLNDSERRIAIKSAFKNSSGLMIFDLCYINWAEFLDQMKGLQTIKK
ncbi:MULTISPECIES: family 10 glycosylhydrolase [Flavobacterium]|uniref:family 10 glycosylhydrolase n=1 Tax=Flavobacterium TaxID=237 RepID=UPI001182C049|nr:MULTISPECIES: family 10 glycosylhydrolase [Flavobacterium]MCR4030685.1 family 10 glycosylhydrolase [Flavobacterium panacis]